MSNSRKKVSSSQGYSGIYNRKQLITMAAESLAKGESRFDFIDKLTHRQLGNPKGTTKVHIRSAAKQEEKVHNIPDIYRRVAEDQFKGARSIREGIQRTKDVYDLRKKNK